MRRLGSLNVMKTQRWGWGCRRTGAATWMGHRRSPRASRGADEVSAPPLKRYAPRVALLFFFFFFFLIPSFAIAQVDSASFADISSQASAAREANDIPHALDLYRQG